MPIHDWTRVPAGIFHHVHHSWITEISRALNAGLLPEGYYALAEQYAAGVGPDVLTLQGSPGGETEAPPAPGHGPRATLAAPAIHPTAETEMEFYRRKQNAVAVRHVSDDRVVAMVEIVSPGNKNSRKGLQAFPDKATKLLDNGIHLLVVDLFPPGRRDPGGIHAAIWEELSGEEAQAPDRPLTAVAYETDLTVRAYLRHFAVGDELPAMPLFLEPGGQVPVPLEPTYAAAFAALPTRWRQVLQAP